MLGFGHKNDDIGQATSSGLGTEMTSPGAVTRADSADHAIVLHARLGRALMGSVVGAALGAAGVAFQTLVRNPLADPYVLGVSSGAAVGAGLAIAFASATSTALVGPAAFAILTMPAPRSGCQSRYPSGHSSATTAPERLPATP